MWKSVCNIRFIDLNANRDIIPRTINQDFNTDLNDRYFRSAKIKTLSYVILCKMIYVYMMFFKSVLEQPTIQMLIGYNIEFFRLNIKKIKITTSDCCTFCNDMSEL